MARRTKTTNAVAPQRQPSLIFPKAEVAKKLADRIARGAELHDRVLRTRADVDAVKAEQNKWHDYNVEYLARCFDVSSISESHAARYGYGALIMNPSVDEAAEGFRTGINRQINHVESILERLDLIPEESAQKTNSIEKTGNRVFLVHGHDEAAKTTVARFIEKLGIDLVILHEQPNQGQTIIEKFEANTADVGYAVVLLTPDDIGASRSAPDQTSPRARQNVILELGYFCGVLGRSHVCVLYGDGVEIPSDYLGVVYTNLDQSGGWQLQLAKELKASGMNIDLNLAM